jgi:hypothetical protein
MGSFSNYLELEILDHLFAKSTFSSPTIYVALSTADPLDTGAGLAEPSGNNYSRVLTSENDWHDAAAGLIDNHTVITFPEASGSWGTITHFALMDAASNGNVLLSGALTVSKSVGSGDTLSFPAGNIDVTLD